MEHITNFAFRCPSGLYDKLRTLAISEGRSINAELVSLLQNRIDYPDGIERAAALVENFANNYPADIFRPPKPGEHAETVDGCSAAAIRAILPILAEEIRKLK